MLVKSYHKTFNLILVGVRCKTRPYFYTHMRFVRKFLLTTMKQFAILLWTISVIASSIAVIKQGGSLDAIFGIVNLWTNAYAIYKIVQKYG